MSIFGRIYSRLPRPLQVLVDDSQRLHEYGRFMRVAITFGTIGFLYKFGQTMAYMNAEKRPETTEERTERRNKEREVRDRMRKSALQAGTVKPPSDDHIRRVIQEANS
jgi:hypothetical protein